MALGLVFRISEEVVSRVRCLLVHAQPRKLPDVGFGVWGLFRVYDIWLMVYGLWIAVFGLCFMLYDLWFMFYGLCFMVYGLWSMVQILEFNFGA